MKHAKILIALLVVALIGFLVFDNLVISRFREEFKVLERQRIITVNKLTTVKIITQRMDHVRDLVFKNMDFPGQKDTVAHETHVFDFLTECVKDLKLKLVGIKPFRPEVSGSITTYGYELQLEGDFFQFGELCSKLENSRRIFSVDEFEVALIDNAETLGGAPENKKIKITMLINTYRIKKGKSGNDDAPVAETKGKKKKAAKS